MQPTQQQKIWPWLIGGCTLLVIAACVITLAFGTAATFLATGLFLMNRGERPMPPVEEYVEGHINVAVLQDLQGWVEVETASGKWLTAEPEQVITAGQRIRTGPLSSVVLQFQDGSQARLKADTEIALDTLITAEGEETRSIVMTQFSGESTHQVVPNQSQSARYEVNTPSGTGEARGTEFEVIVTPQETTYYYVLEGKVAVTALETTVLVKPGFMTILYFDQPPLKPLETITVEGLVSDTGSQWTVAGTTFITDDDTVISGSPQAGDWVRVKGHLDENEQNVADWVVLVRRAMTNQFTLTGTVEVVEEGQWKVNGQPVVISEATEIDETIAVGDTVYVSGIVETGGILNAVRIERMVAEEGLPFSFTGVLQDMQGSRWDVSGVTITTGEDTRYPEDLEPGVLVLVKGLVLEDGDWLAQEITQVSEDEPDFSFTGHLEDTDPWKVAGILFETRDYTLIPDDLKPGDLVRVEGKLDADGVWIAAKIVKVLPEAGAQMILIGTVLSTDPWIINGTTLVLAPDVVIGEDITVGMLVQVELVLQADGSWQVVIIEPVSDVVWFPGCMEVVATVVSLEGSQLRLVNWPLVSLAEDAAIEGELTPNSIIRMRVCFDENMIIRVTYIFIIEPGEIEVIVPPDDGGGEKVLVCHKPDKKKGGHTLSISRSALPAHLGHGDYEGPCR